MPRKKDDASAATLSWRKKEVLCVLTAKKMSQKFIKKRYDLFHIFLSIVIYVKMKMALKVSWEWQCATMN